MAAAGVPPAAVLACDGGYKVHLPGLGLELGPVEDRGWAERALDVLRLRLAVESGSDVRAVEVSACAHLVPPSATSPACFPCCVSRLWVPTALLSNATQSW